MRRFCGRGRAAEDYVHSHARKVSELLNGNVVSVAPDASLEEVVAIMESRGVRRVLVLDEDRLVGIVARADLIRGLMTLMPGATTAPAVTDAQIRAQFLRELEQQPWSAKGAVDAEVKDRVVELHGVILDERSRTALCVMAENIKGGAQRRGPRGVYRAVHGNDRKRGVRHAAQRGIAALPHSVRV